MTVFNPASLPDNYTENLRKSLRAEREVGKAFERSERNYFRNRAIILGIGVLAAAGFVKYTAEQPTEVESKPKVEYVMQDGDTATQVARVHNPNEDIRNEADYIHNQDLDGDGKFEEGQRVMVPYTELPDANKSEDQPRG